jgi:uncharacterized protein
MSRIALYGGFLIAVALIVMYASGPIRGYSGPVRVAEQNGDAGPVRISPQPSPTHEPFAAPTPFELPLRSKSLAELNALLKKHDAEAQCEMGVRLDEGTGVAKDPQSATLLFELSAKQNNGCGLTNVGNLAYYQDDYDTAAQYYHKGAALGYPAAFNNLGSVALYGKHDEVEAYKWFREAAERGYVKAYDLTGSGYITGRYGQPDKWLAFQWYQLGAQAGDFDSMRDMAWYYIYQSDEPDRYQEAMSWLKKAPCKCSDFEIGRLYLKGLGVTADVNEAARYFKHAADEGYSPAETAYANLLRHGDLGPADPQTALRYYGDAAAQGDGEAMDAIAQMTEQGVGVPADPEAAETLYAAAAAHCSADALLRLAKISAAGSARHPQDLDEADALAGLSVMCGGDIPSAEAVLKPIQESGKLNIGRMNKFFAQYRSTIHDYTGNPNFVPYSPLPPVPEVAKTPA